MVVLRDGDIRVVKNGTTLAQPFLSIPDVDSKSGPGFEGGLLSMAFSPDYLTSGRFYVFMVRDDADPGVAPHGPIEIREYKRSAANPDVADPATKRRCWRSRTPIAPTTTAERCSSAPTACSTRRRATGPRAAIRRTPDTDSQLGKLLRLDPRQLGAAPYRVPPGNPFANGAGGDPLVYAWGLRNPFRFSFDRLNGDLTIGDVGQNTFEEIDFAPSPGRGLGADFGWNVCEGLMRVPRPGSALQHGHASGPCLRPFVRLLRDRGRGGARPGPSGPGREVPLRRPLRGRGPVAGPTTADEPDDPPGVGAGSRSWASARTRAAGCTSRGSPPRAPSSASRTTPIPAPATSP